MTVTGSLLRSGPGGSDAAHSGPMRPALLLLLAPALALAQPAAPGAWLDTPAAREFRQRVVQLATIYGESGGIDPEGYRIEAALQGRDARGCALVDVRILQSAKLVRREQQASCGP